MALLAVMVTLYLVVVNLMLLKAVMVGGGVYTVIFMSNPTTVLRLCCVGVVTKYLTFLFPFKDTLTFFFFEGCVCRFLHGGGKEKFGGKNPLFLKKLKIYCSGCNSIPKYLVLYYKRKEGNIQGSYKTN